MAQRKDRQVKLVVIDAALGMLAQRDMSTAHRTRYPLRGRQ